MRDSWQAELTGSGAIAHAGAVAAGQGGVAVAGDVAGDIIGGDKVEFVVVQSSRIEDYLRYLVQSQTRISLLAIDPSAVEPSRNLHLSDIFIAPYSFQQRPPSSSRESDREPISMLEAIADDRRVLILGDPGSGKTTFLKYLVGDVARQRFGEAKELPSEITGFPLLVRARDYASISPEEMALPFVEFLARHLASLGFSDLIDYVKGQLAAGECIILMDGLDELVSERHRRQIVTQIEDFGFQYPDNRIIITGRIASLQDVPLFSAGWARHVIAPFDEEQIVWFISAWYQWLASTGMVDTATAEEQAKRLSHALRQYRQLGELASNPLLLTVIATLHTFRGRLPEDRVTLYSETSNLLFARWEQTKAPEMSLLERLGIPGLRISDLQAALAEVAFRMQTSNETMIDKAGLIRTIAPYLDSNWDKALRFAEYMSERTGLLIERAAEQYSFVHLTFQEFFAARYLSSQTEYPRIGVELLIEDFHRWREVYLQSILYLAQSHGTSRALEAIRALCPPAQWNPHLSEDIDLLKLILAGQAIVEMGLLSIERTETGKQIVESVRANLAQLVRSGRLSASERAWAGDILAEVGDPRPGFSSTLVGDLLVPDITWCEIPAGPFLMGSSEPKDANAYEDEKPQHRVELHSYRIGLYPVTNAQYRLFVEGGGYEDSRYWLEEGWFWRSENGIVAPEFWDEPMWNSLNRPVVGVSWYEAMAFASWLAAQLEMPVCLPTEAEWEKAARGDDGRIYPWGDAWDPERANTQETGIGQTSPIGIHPAGASPYGCLDMSGNIWEWTLSLWGQQDARPDFGYPYDPSDGREDQNTKGKRIIRGGSWAASLSKARIAFRGVADPEARNRFIGFRCKSVSVVDEAVQRAITRIKQAGGQS
jgi:formylglycine-generating enzyme required for sulfatase activity